MRLPPDLGGPVKELNIFSSRGCYSPPEESKIQPMKPVTIIGGGLAGSEAAWQLLSRGVPVRLFEMKPRVYSPAHRSPFLAELVCSNSFRSENLSTAVGLLKQEMKLMNSLIMEAALASRVPAGKALAVDRELFAHRVEKSLVENELCTIERYEVKNVPGSLPLIIATGPLTSDDLARDLLRLTGSEAMFFYDAISPVVEADSIDHDVVFRASRYEKGEGDYLNCPLNKRQYEVFHRAVLDGREIELKDFEDRKCFEGCLPIEVLARRGIDTLRYGPMKPVGLTDPRTGFQPWAVVQLRKENLQGSLYNMVGFQTKLARPEQERIFRMIPGLDKARFARFGTIHRNTFLDSPRLLDHHLELKDCKDVFFAGQITGVEGYLESAATGLLAGINTAFLVKEGELPEPPPSETALGALMNHVTNDFTADFQPTNINFGLFPPLEEKTRKKERGGHYARRALKAIEKWKKSVDPHAFRS